MFEIEKMENEFDYSLVDSETADFLRSCEYEMNGIAEDARLQFGRVLKKAQDKLAKYGSGVFSKWYESGGLDRNDVYYAINLFDSSRNLEEQKKKNFLNAPKTLQKEVMKKNAPEELKQKVYDGDITTNKEYQELKRKLREAERAKQQAESQAEQAMRSERIAQKQLDEELSKEPKVVERVIEDTSKIERLEQELNLMKRKLEKESQDAETYRQLKKDIDKLESEKSQVIRQINNVSSIGKFISKVERSFEEDLAPVKYSDAISELSNSDVAVESLEKIVSKVENWCEEIRGLMKDKNIVEVIDYEEK